MSRLDFGLPWAFAPPDLRARLWDASQVLSVVVGPVAVAVGPKEQLLRSRHTENFGVVDGMSLLLGGFVQPVMVSCHQVVPMHIYFPPKNIQLTTLYHFGFMSVTYLNADSFCKSSTYLNSNMSSTRHDLAVANFGEHSCTTNTTTTLLSSHINSQQRRDLQHLNFASSALETQVHRVPILLQKLKKRLNH